MPLRLMKIVFVLMAFMFGPLSFLYAQEGREGDL